MRSGHCCCFLKSIVLGNLMLACCSISQEQPRLKLNVLLVQQQLTAR